MYKPDSFASKLILLKQSQSTAYVEIGIYLPDFSEFRYRP